MRDAIGSAEVTADHASATQDGNVVKDCLFIVGAGREQERAFEVARELSLEVVASDRDEAAPMRAFADYFLAASTFDAEATARAAEYFSANVRPISGVMTIANDCAPTVAAVAERLGLRGIRRDTAELSRNKWAFKQLLEANDICSPIGAVTKSMADIASVVRDIPGDRLIVKPVSGRGAEGVALVAKGDVARLEVCWQFAREIDPKQEVLIEEFVSGVQLSTESFVQGGKVFTPVLCERNYTRIEQFSPAIIEDGGTIPALLSPLEEERVRAVLARVVEVLEITDGILKGDLVIGPRGVCVLEVALRLSGGWFASDQVRIASGVDLVKAVVLQAIGREVPEFDLVPSLNRSTAIRYWFPEAGTIVAIDGVGNVTRARGVERVDISRSVGDELGPVRSHRDRFGSVLCSGETRDEAIDNAHRALRCLNIVTTGGANV